MNALQLEEAARRMPACLICAYENLQADSGQGHNKQDMLDAIEHELTMYAEDQDGCITAKERKQVGEFERWLRTQ